MANRNWSSGGKLYTMHTMPVLLDCNFIVDSTNGNGLGIRSLKGPGIANVYMQTSSTKDPASPGGTTGPAAGVIVVQLEDNYNRSLSGFNSIVSPVSGSALLVASAGLTTGVAYIITTLGTTTTQHWHDLGVPPGVTPAVGVSFIAALTSTTGTGAVMIAKDSGSGIFSIETVGNPNLSIAPDPTVGQKYGAQIILECRKDSAGDAPTVAAPADGTVISLAFLLSNSSVSVKGE